VSTTWVSGGWVPLLNAVVFAEDRCLRRPQNAAQVAMREIVGIPHVVVRADEVARGLQLRLDAVERGDHLGAAERGARVVDAHVHAERDAQRGERRAIDGAYERRSAGRHEC